jgi:hypothetical protein
MRVPFLHGVSWRGNCWWYAIYMSEEKYVHEQHTVHHILYHIIFCPKRRRKVLVGSIHDRLKRIIEQVADEHEWQIVTKTCT